MVKIIPMVRGDRYTQLAVLASTRCHKVVLTSAEGRCLGVLGVRRVFVRGEVVRNRIRA
jgi:hypothetical protein